MLNSTYLLTNAFKHLIPPGVLPSHECVHDRGLGDEVDEEEAVEDGQAHQQPVEVPVRRRSRPEGMINCWREI